MQAPEHVHNGVLNRYQLLVMPSAAHDDQLVKLCTALLISYCDMYISSVYYVISQYIILY
jgi:hypothetical protein